MSVNFHNNPGSKLPTRFNEDFRVDVRKVVLVVAANRFGAREATPILIEALVAHVLRISANYDLEPLGIDEEIAPRAPVRVKPVGHAWDNFEAEITRRTERVIDRLLHFAPAKPIP